MFSGKNFTFIMTIDDRKYLKKIMESPEGEFERAQSQRLRSFSERYEEIIAIRQKLKEMKEDLEASEQSLQFQHQLFQRFAEIPKFRNRYYDRSIFKVHPTSFLGRISHYFELKRKFKHKYVMFKPISASIINYIINGAPFYPSDETCAFVQNILILQEELREIARRMYTAGWLDRIGADVLTPFEYNLISELERLTADPSIFNFLIYRRKPHIAIKKINPFLGYFLSLTRNSEHRMRLFTAVKKSLQKIVQTELTDTKSTDIIISKLEQLLSHETLIRFIIPLFECAYTQAFTVETIFSLISLDEIDETCYRADAKLLEAMEEKKRIFNDALKKSIFQLEEELNFVLDLKNSIAATYELPNERVGNFLDYLRYYYYHARNLSLPAKDHNVAITAGDLCDIFTLCYEAILSEGVSIKISNEIKTIKLFEQTLFQKEIESIRNNRRALISYDRKRYTPHILYSDDIDSEKAFFIKSLQELVDSFYFIGEKLYYVIKGNDESSLKEEKIAESSITEKNIGKTRIPFANHSICGKEGSTLYQYLIANRTVCEVLEDIKKFAYNFAHTFEHKKRDLSTSIRKESIAQKIKKLDEIIQQIRELNSGRIHRPNNIIKTQ
ncbi:MAG: hypothetical protein N2316_05265 [Spirochaetes bacterium]|nr:hypothetical protein [Spirochaetota bacterium]